MAVDYKLQKYRKEEKEIQGRNSIFGKLSPAQEFIAYATPGIGTVMFANDAAKELDMMKSAAKNKQYYGVVGHGIKIPANLALGAISLMPFAGGLIKAIRNFPKMDANKRALSKIKKLPNDYFESKKMIDLGNESRVYDNGETVLKLRHKHTLTPAQDLSTVKTAGKQLPDNLFLKETPYGYIQNSDGVQLVYELPKIKTDVSSVADKTWDDFLNNISNVRVNGLVFDFDPTGKMNPYNTNIGIDNNGNLVVFDWMYNPDRLGRAKIFFNLFLKNGGYLRYFK